MQSVAILCAAPRSVYHTLPGIEVYDYHRDAQTFAGGIPVIAHPPCRAWSAFTRHQAKPAAGEKELGLWCAQQVRKHGGILEQPAHSHLWQAAGLPMPGDPLRRDSFSIAVWQSWWGTPTKKATWLYFSRIDDYNVNPRYSLHRPGGDKRTWQLLPGGNRRAATPLAFAEWLIAIARTCRGYPAADPATVLYDPHSDAKPRGVSLQESR